MRPFVSLISTLLEASQMQKVGNCKKPKYTKAKAKVYRGEKLLTYPTTHYVFAFELSPSPHIKSMTHACGSIHRACAPKKFPLHFTFALISDLHSIDKLPVSLWSTGPSGRSIHPKSEEIGEVLFSIQITKFGNKRA